METFSAYKPPLKDLQTLFKVFIKLYIFKSLVWHKGAVNKKAVF